MSDDSIFREVDEAVRQEQLKSLWDKYGIVMLGGAFLIVAGVSGFKGWNYWQTQQANETGARFIGGITHVEDGKNKEAGEVFADLARNGTAGYRGLAKFRLAGLFQQEGKTQDALKLYEELSGDSSLDTVARDFARIQAGNLKVDTASLEDMHKLLDDISGTTSPWRHSARELLGLSAYRHGKMGEAERYFNVILSDQQSPANLRRRAEMMLSLLVQNTDTSAAKGQ